MAPGAFVPILGLLESTYIPCCNRGRFRSGGGGGEGGRGRGDKLHG